MAYTKIHAVKATINKAIAYICNPAIAAKLPDLKLQPLISNQHYQKPVLLIPIWHIILYSLLPLARSHMMKLTE